MDRGALELWVYSDIVCPTHIKPIIEVLCSETPQMFEELKLPKYPVELQNSFIFVNAKVPFEEIRMVREQSRGSSPVGEERSASFDFKSIFAGGKIGLELSLSSQDRELIGNHLTELQEKVEETSRKVDYRWKVTQWIMGIGITLVCYRTGGIVDISLIRAIARAFLLSLTSTFYLCRNRVG